MATLTHKSINNQRKLALIMALTAVVHGGLSGCEHDVGSLTVNLLKSCRLSDDPFSSRAETLLFTVFGSNNEVVFTRKFRTVEGIATLPDLTRDHGYVLQVEGVSPEGTIVSRGRTSPFTITAGRNEISIYMGRIERFSQTPVPQGSKRCTLSASRAFHTATLLQSGNVLLTGGVNNTWRPEKHTQPSPTSVVEIIDGDAATSSSNGCDDGRCLLSPRVEHTATLLPTGNILIAGGVSDATVDTGPTSSTEIYSANENRFFEGPALSSPRSAHVAVSDNSTVMLFGGRSSENSVTATAEEFDAGSLGQLPPLLEERRNFAAIRLEDGTIWVTGGFGADNSPLATTEIFDPASRTWKAGKNLRVPRAWHTLIALDDASVLVVGGLSTNNEATRAIERHRNGPDPDIVAQLSRSRWAHTTALLRDGRVLVIGGFSANIDGSPTQAVEQITRTGVNGFATSPCCGQGLIKPRAGHTSVVLPSGWVLVTGGITETNNSVSVDDTAEVFVY